MRKEKWSLGFETAGAWEFCSPDLGAQPLDQMDGQDEPHL
jgi:hypothetical protein